MATNSSTRFWQFSPVNSNDRSEGTLSLLSLSSLITSKLFSLILMLACFLINCQNNTRRLQTVADLCKSFRPCDFFCWQAPSAVASTGGKFKYSPINPLISSSRRCNQNLQISAPCNWSVLVNRIESTIADQLAETWSDLLGQTNRRIVSC